MRLVITMDFEPDEDDPLSATHGPKGLLEALLPFGDDIEIEVEP